MLLRRKTPGLLGAAWLLASCGSSPSISGEADELADQDLDGTISVSSTAFAEGAPIPVQHSCDGDDVSPPLAWEGVPDGAEALALVLDDPDAGGGTYVHWVLYGLDPSLTGLDEGALPDGARQADNADGNSDYAGPCPPEADDAHTYRFTLYALDEAISADDGSGQADVLGDIRDAAVARGTLTGTFDH
jgi:Raf kinase inhibitor-like YbhB/YbcL family protein